jgi:DNA repair protein RadC
MANKKPENNEKTNIHAKHRERVRKRYMTSGLDGFDDHQALELLLFYAVPRRDTNELAHKILQTYGTLHNLLDSDAVDIARRCGVSESTAILISMFVPMFRKYNNSRAEKRAVLDDSMKAGNYAVNLLRGKTRENFYLICLNSQRREIFAALISSGTTNETSLYPRQIVEAALKHNAVSVILAHNHPSGILAASANDIEATRAIIDVLDSINIDVLDHIIVTDDKYLSFSEKRLLGMGYNFT